MLYLVAVVFSISCPEKIKGGIRRTVVRSVPTGASPYASPSADRIKQGGITVMARIIEAYIENLTRVEFVEIRNAGNTIEINGECNSGKTGIIDTLIMMTGGKKHMPDDPVHDDAEKGESRIVLDDGLMIEVVVKRKGDDGYTYTATIREADGTKADGTPGAILVRLFGTFAKDPVELDDMLKTTAGRRKVKEMVLKRLKLAFDYDKRMGNTKRLREIRKKANWELDAVKKALKDLPEADEDMPEEEISITTLAQKIEVASNIIAANKSKQDELRRLHEHAAKLKSKIGVQRKIIETTEEKIEAAKTLTQNLSVEVSGVKEKNVTAIDDEIVRLEEELAAARKKRDEVLRFNSTLHEHRAELSAAQRAEKRELDRKAELGIEMQTLQNESEAVQAKVDEMTIEVDKLVHPEIEKLKEELAQAEEKNKDIRDNLHRVAKIREKEIEFQKKQARSDKLTGRIKALDAATTKAMEEADFPVEGLSIDGDYLTYNGRLLHREGTGQRITVLSELIMSTNPKVKALFVRNGDSLDEKMYARLLKKAADAKPEPWQVWVAKHQNSGRSGIELHEGKVKSVRM